MICSTLFPPYDFEPFLYYYKIWNQASGAAPILLPFQLLPHPVYANTTPTATVQSVPGTIHLGG